jgi:adenylate cyclase
MYGNVGTRNRLDFTVIGPAVNYAARLEKVCAALGKPLLLSEAVAGLADGRVMSVGRHRLKDIDTLQTVYELAP